MPLTKTFFSGAANNSSMQRKRLCVNLGDEFVDCVCLLGTQTVVLLNSSHENGRAFLEQKLPSVPVVIRRLNDTINLLFKC